MSESIGTGVNCVTDVDCSSKEEDSGRQLECVVEMSRVTRDRSYQRVQN